MIEPPPGWNIETRHDSVLVLPATGFDTGGIRYKERIRPLGPFPELAREHFEQSKFEPKTLSAPERRVTQEGEHAWFVTARGHMGKRWVQRDLAFILLDDAYARLSSVVFDEAEFSGFTRVVRDLAISDRHFLGVRRRWFEYTPPPTWRSRPRGFRTEWSPLAFPRERAMLVVWPALPRDAVGDEDVALGGVIGAHPSAAVIDAAPVGVTASGSGLMGKARHVVRKTADGTALHTYGVVLVDERYVYPLRLEVSDDAQREHAQVLDEVLRTVVPVPKPQVVARDVPTGIWNE